MYRYIPKKHPFPPLRGGFVRFVVAIVQLVEHLIAPTPSLELGVGVPTEQERASGWFRTDMAFIYILKSKKNGDYYVGSTDHFEQRIKQHENGQVHTTRRLLPVEVVLKQECKDAETARKIELKIKKWKRRDYIERIVSDGHIKILD